MHNEFTAVFERDDDWYVAYSPEIPDAEGWAAGFAVYTFVSDISPRLPLAAYITSAASRSND